MTVVMMRERVQPTRRGLIRGLGLLVAAPAIVKVANIMPVRALPLTLIDDSFLGNMMSDIEGRYVEGPVQVCVEPGFVGNAKWVIWEKTKRVFPGTPYAFPLKPGDR